MKLNFRWVENKAQFGTGEFLYHNRIRLAVYYWNSSRSREDETNIWVGHVDLPSVNPGIVYSESQDEIKAKIEKVVTDWFTEALKEIANG